MSKNSAIEICLRVRPTKKAYQELMSQESKVQFFIPKEQDQGYINNQKQKRVFQYDQVFDMDATQQKIFDRCAKDVIDSAMEGYNGTIFAYGQTGSGKTFTMTGGNQSYQDRGIIPRTLSYIFNECQKRAGRVTVEISYVQIYNGIGYDLLEPDNVTKQLMKLPRVIPREGPNGQIKLQNLSPHHAATEEDALNLLFIGDTNRVVSKTPKNDESTRSHCIFIIRIQTQKPGSDIKTVASIHLVDLSGSERIKETGVEDLLKKQAISINLGLHFLERVIVELNKKARGENVHIPYRQSLMTTILRDSIGGNCKTRMIATVSAKEEDIMQSISTCRFAMRVALVKNDLQKNQSVDPAVIIERLKKQNAQLKAQLALLKGQQVKEELDKYEIEDCHKLVEDYLQNNDPQATIILTDRLKINQCFYHFKNLFKKGNFSVNKSIQNESKGLSENKSIVNEEEGGRMADQIKRLKLLVQQRDNQITLLLTLIQKKKGEAKQLLIPVQRNQEDENLMKSIIKDKDKPMVMREQELMRQVQRRESQIYNKEGKKQNQSSTQYQSVNQNSKLQKSSQMQQISRILTKPVNLNSQQMLDHALAFEKFRKNYRKFEAMQQNQQIKAQKMAKGKQLGRILNQIRDKTNKLKSKLQQIKKQNAIDDLINGKDQPVHPQQQEIRTQLMRLKEIHKSNFQKLKNIKLEVQNIDNLQKKNEEAMKNDFLKWITFKSQERNNMTQQIDSSLLASGIKDKQVQKHLQSFFKARDQIRKK